MSGGVGGAVHSIILRDAWGKQVHKAGTATIGTAYLYTGQRWDELLGLYDYNARWYDPGTGRFVSADTVVPDEGDPQAYSRYTYVLNGPLNFVDQSGHNSKASQATDENWGDKAKDKLGEWLVDEMKKAYESEKPGRLENLYWLLVIGGWLNGLRLASSMMRHFLEGSGTAVRVDEESLLGDQNVMSAVEAITNDIEAEAIRVALEQGSGTYRYQTRKLVAAADRDLWYAMGRFYIDVVATINVADNGNGELTVNISLNFSVQDMYDWHNGLAAGGTEGIAAVSDEWANYLIEQGRAQVFLMFATWQQSSSSKVRHRIMA